MFDLVTLQALDMAQDFKLLMHQANMAAQVAEEMGNLRVASVHRRFAKCFRELEGLSVELLGLHAEEHGLAVD